MAHASERFNSAGILFYDIDGRPVRVYSNKLVSVDVASDEHKVDLMIKVVTPVDLEG
jgi:hypothetical protein